VGFFDFGYIDRRVAVLDCSYSQLLDHVRGKHLVEGHDHHPLCEHGRIPLREPYLRPAVDFIKLRAQHDGESRVQFNAAVKITSHHCAGIPVKLFRFVHLGRGKRNTGHRDVAYRERAIGRRLREASRQQEEDGDDRF
jgi:hypothetical protein